MTIKGSFSFLDPPNAQPGDYVEPTGVNACGSIVGIVHRTGNTISPARGWVSNRA